MILLKILFFLLALFFVLGLVVLAGVLMGAKKMADTLKQPPRPQDGEGSGPQLEARACPYCGTFVAAPPKLDRDGTCDQCGKQAQRARR
jgi:uncharacterized paraquat-inducible protein A